MSSTLIGSMRFCPSVVVVNEDVKTTNGYEGTVKHQMIRIGLLSPSSTMMTYPLARSHSPNCPREDRHSHAHLSSYLSRRCMIFRRDRYIHHDVAAHANRCQDSVYCRGSTAKPRQAQLCYWIRERNLYQRQLLAANDKCARLD